MAVELRETEFQECIACEKAHLFLARCCGQEGQGGGPGIRLETPEREEKLVIVYPTFLLLGLLWEIRPRKYTCPELPSSLGQVFLAKAQLPPPNSPRTEEDRLSFLNFKSSINIPVSPFEEVLTLMGPALS